ncbi:hypothetical protein ACOMHN_016237 [Nucella lapillus]
MAVAVRDTDPDRELLLQEAVAGARWPVVIWYLRHTHYHYSRRRWAIEQIAKHGSFGDIDAIFTDGYADDCLDIVVPHLTRRRLWLLVGFALRRNLCPEQKSSIVAEASQHAEDDSFAVYISHHCRSTDWGQVFTGLVSRGMWRSVGCALRHDISDTQWRWAVEEASKHSSDWDFRKYIVHQCSEEELDLSVSHLVRRGLWQSLGEVLKQITHPVQRRWILQEAIKHADDDAFVEHIRHKVQNEEEEQEVLIHLVSRNLWKHVGLQLRGVNKTYHEWAVKKASKLAEEDDFVDDILCMCSDEELKMVATNMASQGLWKPLDSSEASDQSLKQHILHHLHSRHKWTAVGKFLSRDIDAKLSRWVIEEAIRAEVDLYNLLPLHYWDVLPLAVQHRQWKWTNALLNDFVFEALRVWLTKGISLYEAMLWKLVHTCRVPVYQALELSKAACGPRMGLRGLWEMYSCFANQTSLSETLSESLMTSLLKVLCYALCSDDVDFQYSTECTQQVHDVYSSIISCIKENRAGAQSKTPNVIQNQNKWTSVFTETADAYKNDPMFILYFLQGLHLFHGSRQGQKDDDTLLVMFAVLPLFPQLQSEALKVMVRQQKWDVLSQACLSHVWEHDRRQLFKAAVEQRQWSVVRQWADHTVHDDQRYWAMKEAFQEKQWGVYLLLADFGLTMREQMHAHYMVAKYADWDTVLALMERGGDVAEVSWLLYNFAEGRLRKTPRGDASVYQQRCQSLMEEEDSLRKKARMDPTVAVNKRQWRTVMFHILNGPSEDYFALVTKQAIEDRAWHVLMHVVRLGMSRAERDGLFPDMVSRQQWAVCRMLLEYGVDVSLCIEALPELMERNQWMLVARVMEYSVDDAVRCQVMQCAFQRREGALFWHCLTTMDNEGRLSVETRVRLFHQAISRDIWQAVKPLVEEKDDSGIHCRDMAFLEAIEQHLWDVVDHCQILGADINMEDENGETPLHREARKKEWKAVEEIVFRDGKPNLLDKDGVSVLNRLIDYCQWGTVKFVIKYGADIHLTAKTVTSLKHCGNEDQTFCSPLQTLISSCDMDLIDFTLMWCPNQGQGVTDSRYTALHAACASDRWDLLHLLVARRADPLALTRTGHSALAYAAVNRHCPRRMLAQCITLGFGAHQPALTRLHDRVVDDIIVQTGVWRYSEPEDYLVVSPFLLSLMHGLPAGSRMLHESGSCSNAELFQLQIQLPDLVNPLTKEGERLRKVFHQRMICHGSADFMSQYYLLQWNLQTALPLLREVASTPRSLKSSCRLVISRCLDIRRKRHKDIQRLPLIPELKDYLMFLDVTDPL